VDRVMECLTLEDEIRELRGVAVSAWKSRGKRRSLLGAIRSA